jgi:hypothetical protein
MQIHIIHDRPEEGPQSGPVRVGWLLKEAEGSIVFFAPERVRSAEMNRTHAKSASRCPAVINIESRYFQIRCPYDLHLRFERDPQGQPVLRNLLGDMSPVRRKKLNQLLSITTESEWRYADRPTIQLSLPYFFVTDEPVYLSQLPPFFHYARTPWPGTLFCGRFPIDVWPRQLMWAFEWHDITKDLKIDRGDPLFYCHFETTPQDRAVQVIEVERTPALEEYMAAISGAVNYVNQSFSLFKAAAAIRPETLIVPKKR